MRDDEPRARAKQVFLEALDKEGNAREAWLQERCGGDPQLRRLVEGLLRAHARAGSFLGGEAAARDRAGNGRTDRATDLLRPGARVGPYLLLRVIGEGGFGVVFYAEQEEPIVRRVALKIIKLGMDTRQVVARFEAERQALALMDHPGIAKVLDAGTTDDGRPYFVMEYVPGQPITDFCDTRKLGVRARLELCEQVCLAVQHAHQKGVIHRDIKPSNVLVTIIDGRPVPKVIDFGVAKATGSRLAERSLTQSHQLVGTPEYMSPEQVSPSGQDIDTRSDVYSLGVLLYRLLTGVSPYGLERLGNQGLADWLRVICEESAPRPSSCVHPRAKDSEAAVKRATSPERLSRELRNDLDWIVLKAIEKDRNLRYPTAYSLASDIRHHLDGEPVEAGPPSTLYRVRKFCRRHRTGVLAVVSMLVLSVIAAAVSLRFAIFAFRSRDDAQRARDAAERQAYSANVYAAVAALRAHNSEAARRYLDRAPPALRHWEWRHLDRQVDRSALVLHPAPGRARSVAFSPSGALLACSWDDGRIRVFDSRNGNVLAELVHPNTEPRQLAFSADGQELYAGTTGGELLRVRWRVGEIDTWIGHAGRISAVVPSRDGSLLATASWDGTARLWRTATGRLERTLEHPASVDLVRWSGDGARLVSTSWDQRLTLWNARSGERIARKRGARDSTPIVPPAQFPDALVCAVAFVPDADVVFTGTRDGMLAAWSTADGMRIWQDGRHRDLIRDVAVSPDGKRLAAASRDRTITLWDARRRTLIAMLDAHDDDVRSVAFSPDSRWLASASWDKSVKLWNARDGRLVTTLLGHTGGVFAVHFAADGSRFATHSTDGTVRVWSLGAALADALLARSFVLSLAFGPKGMLVTADREGPARVWDLNRRETTTVLPHGSGVSCVAVHPEGTSIATGSPDPDVRIWVNGRKHRVLRGHTAAIQGLAFSRDGSLLASASKDRTVRIWDVASYTEIARCEGHQGEVKGVEFDGTGTLLVTASRDGTARVFEVATGRQVRVLWTRPGEWIHAIAVHPDGERLALGCTDRSIGLFDLVSGTCARVLQGHASSVNALAWLPDGSRLVSGSDDRTVRLWDPATGENVATLLAHTRQVQSLAVSRDGDAIVSGDENGLIRVFRAPAPRLRAGAPR